MRAVVRTGTGRACEIPGLDVCGKTGTAQTGRGADHAWFTCFAPQTSPRLAVTVLVENGGFGAQAALPVAKALLLEARRLGYFP
jgi:cell division protein FtsI/penicillin-binding protein 2